MTDALSYIIRPAEPGAQAELYLPKKSIYQGALYETLTRGFDIEHVRSHFRDPSKRPRIEALIQGQGLGPIEPDQLVQVFSGYSLYEVDGVFKTADRSRPGQTDEERVQVIRLIFRPDVDEARRIQPDPERLRQLAEALRTKGSGPQDALETLGSVSDADRRALDLISSFLVSVRLFLVGYLMFEICDRLVDLHDRTGHKLEDEIWITLTPDLMLNRFIIPSQSGG